MENRSFQEPYLSKQGDQPPAYTPGPPVMQPSPYLAYYPPGPDHSVQQTLICQPTSTNVVEVNGQVASTRPQYKDYLVWSILNCLCCFWPLGIAAIVFSCKTRSDIDAHDYDAAARNSRTTFNLNISALVIGIIIVIVIFVVYYFALY